MKKEYIFVFIIFAVIASSNSDWWLSCKSNSMLPAFDCHNRLWMNKTDDIRFNDIIWFRTPKEYRQTIKTDFVVHRIIARRREGWVTKGDNNIYKDPWIIKDEDIWFKVYRIE